jgi:hypothetical protein
LNTVAGNSNLGNGGDTSAATGGAADPATGGKQGTGGRQATGGKASTGGAAVATGGQPIPSGGSTGSSTGVTVYADPISGQYHLGPVDFAETEWPNACTPAGGYRQELRDETGLGGEYLAGLATQHAQAGGTCDACILIKTATGRQIVARVVTYGTENAAGDIDVSPSVYAALNTGEYPRSMTWQFAKCPDTGTLEYEFQTEANPWWTSLWVRNPRVPITKVEVQSTNHSSFFTLRRESDGTVNDDGGFGEGAFTLRITAMDGQVITDTLPGFEAGQLVVSTKQFQ